MTDTLLRAASVHSEQVERYMARFHVPRPVARWLCVRDIREDDVPAWLDPTRMAWTPPESFSGMSQAVAALKRAIQEGMRIAIVGDYDVDGVTSSTIVASTLSALRADWCSIIPHRVEDGYGLSTKLVDRAFEQGCRILLTVDNGIRALEAVQYALQRGMQVIVTDHHEPGDELPSGVTALIHWVNATTDEVSGLSGAGVAWKLAEMMLREMGTDLLPPEDLASLRDWHCGLAALGAIADLMPMRGENRKLVVRGIERLHACRKPGWLALCEIAGVNPNELTDTRIAWSIAPRLNAAGRMGSADTAFRLLMAAEPAEAAACAAQIEDWNRERKQQTEHAFVGACEQIERNPDMAGVPIQIVAGSWPLGVVGIVAARLVDRYGVPAVVLADDGNDLLRGSGRAQEGFPLYETLAGCASWFEHFGGHEAAVGCAVTRNHLPQLQRAAIAAAETVELTEVPDAPVADDYLALSDATPDTVAWLRRFAPFGPQNPAFAFYVGPVEVARVTPMGNGKHVRVTVREGKTTVDLVWFNAPSDVVGWRPGTIVAAICNLEENVWKGVTRAQLQVKSAYLMEHPLMRDDFGAVYRLLQARRKLSEVEAEKVMDRHRNAEASVIFDTFVELGFAQRQESAYHVVEQVVSRDLRESTRYQAHLRKSAGTRY